MSPAPVSPSSVISVTFEPPLAGVPTTVAVFDKPPAFTSSWVTTYVAVNRAEAFGASVVLSPDSKVKSLEEKPETLVNVVVPRLSVSLCTPTPVSVTFPVLVAVIV